MSDGVASHSIPSNIKTADNLPRLVKADHPG